MDNIPKEAIIGRVKDAVDSGRYDITGEKTDRGYSFTAHSKRPKNAVEFKERTGRDTTGWHDPEISHIVTPYPEDDYPRHHAELNPDSGYTRKIDAQRTPGVLYRGMSHEEFHNMKSTGEIKSHGNFNMEGQEGLTYFSHSPSQAESYAHSFAPLQFKGTGQHKVYVVAVKDPGTGVTVPGVGSDEVGIPHAVKTSEILHYHEGRSFAGSPSDYDVEQDWGGKFKEGSSTTNGTSIAWKKHEALYESAPELEHPKIEVDGVMKHRNNSEGRPIHHTDEGIKNFHRWFGDSKVVDQHGRPQVVYHGTRRVEKETPKHDVPIDTFKSESGIHWFSHNTSVSDMHAGVYQRDGKQQVLGYDGNTIPVYIKAHHTFDATTLPTDKVKNPAGVFTDELSKQAPNKKKSSIDFFKTKNAAYSSPENTDHIEKAWDHPEHTKHYKNLGFDSIKGHMSLHDTYDSPTIGVFSSGQIKSAISNDGTFDHPKKISENYIGSHEAPDPESGAPAHDLTQNGIYPKDFYEGRHNEYGDHSERPTIAQMLSLKGKPNRPIKVYRAVPYVPSKDERINELEQHKRHILKTGKVPSGVNTSLDSNAYYTHAINEIEKIKNEPASTQEKMSINHGDWVTPDRNYAKEHGDGQLGGKGKYKILSKTVKASEIYCDGNIQEFGYHPTIKESFEEQARRLLEI